MPSRRLARVGLKVRGPSGVETRTVPSRGAEASVCYGAWMDCRWNAFCEIAAKHGVSDVRVFGSRARGDARPDSDLDLLVTPGPDTTLLTMAALRRELEENLGISVEVATERSIRPSHKVRVMSEAKPLVAA